MIATIEYSYNINTMCSNYHRMMRLWQKSRPEIKTNSTDKPIERACFRTLCANGCKNRLILWYLAQIMIAIDLYCNVNACIQYTSYYVHK